jgi:hypothetical protein
VLAEFGPPADCQETRADLGRTAIATSARVASSDANSSNSAMICRMLLIESSHDRVATPCLYVQFFKIVRIRSSRSPPARDARLRRLDQHLDRRIRRLVAVWNPWWKCIIFVGVAVQLLARRSEGSKYFERRILSNSLHFQNEIMTRACRNRSPAPTAKSPLERCSRIYELLNICMKCRPS